MSKTTAFEIQTLKDGQWQLASSFDTKDQALQEAHRIYDTSRHLDGVKVYQEDYDAGSNRADTKLVFTV